MRVLIFHGYLLRGTGSNIYNTELCRALAALGHEVHICCQERHPEDVGLPEGVTVHNPDIGRTLPVYVADEYEGFDAVPFPELDDAALDHYLAANVDAVAEVAGRVRPDVALANHLIMGPVVLARALGGRTPYAVKVHGSALEYTVRPHPERFLPYAREGLESASGVLVGSRHTAESLWEVLGDPQLPGRTRLGPPGVDVDRFAPAAPADAAAALEGLAGRLDGTATAGWGGEPGAGAALRSLDPATDPIVSYVGKLIVSKGVDLLLAAWPLVVQRVPDARLCVVGFGTYRDTLHEFVDALAAADLDARARHRGARPRARGRPRGRAGVPGRVPGRHGCRCPRGLRARRAGGGRPGGVHGPARARRPAGPAARLPRPGGAQHVPRGVRHGGRRGRLLRRPAPVGRPLGPGRGHRGAGARPGARSCGRCCRSSAGPGRWRRSPRSSANGCCWTPASASEPRRSWPGRPARASAGRPWRRA